MNNSTLNINDVFFTFQGEGKYAGTRALFVRMPYCNLKCTWCDTEFNTFTKWTVDDFIKKAKEELCRFAVVTGGEPMMNKYTPEVVKILKELGYYVATETNGHYPIVPGIDFVTCSPKKTETAPYYIHRDAWPRVSEFKYVVDDEFDFKILDRHDLKDGRRYSLSPEFNKLEESFLKIQSYITDNPGWKLNLQTHKWIGIK